MRSYCENLISITHKRGNNIVNKNSINKDGEKDTDFQRIRNFQSLFTGKVDNPSPKKTLSTVKSRSKKCE